jgi:hypothetical protein
MFNPVRRYGCTNHLCQYEEAILRKRPPFAQRSIVAAAGLAGAALVSAVVTGLVLYLAPDNSTRAQVHDVYTSVIRPDVDSRLDATLLLPVSMPVATPKYETASILDLSSKSGALTVDFVPSLPTLLLPADAEATESR